MIVGWTRNVQPIFAFSSGQKGVCQQRHFAHLIGKVRGLGRGDPPQNQWVKMDH